MLFKRSLLKRFFLISLFTLSPFAQATVVLINPPAPYPQHTMGQATGTISYAGNFAGTPQPSSYYNGTKGFRFLRTETDIVWFDLSIDNPISVPAGQILVVSFKTQNGLNKIPITGASLATGTGAPNTCASTPGTCRTDATGNYAYANFTNGSALRVSFSISAICSTDNITNLCTGNAADSTFSNELASTNISVNFDVLTDPGNQIVTIPTSSTATASFGLTITDIAPSVTCPTTGNPADYYFPGDQQIYISPTQYAVASNGGADEK